VIFAQIMRTRLQEFDNTFGYSNLPFAPAFSAGALYLPRLNEPVAKTMFIDMRIFLKEAEIFRRICLTSRGGCLNAC